MKKQYMLCKNWEFDAIINSKKQLTSKALVVYFKKAPDFKVGISVPKKFANAVYRNYYKRQVKAILDQYTELLNFKNHLVIIVRKAFLNMSFEQKKQELLTIIERIKVGK